MLILCIGEVNLSSTIATRVYFNIPYQPVSTIKSIIQKNKGPTSVIEIVLNIQLHTHQENYSIECLSTEQLFNAKLPQGSEVNTYYNSNFNIVEKAIISHFTLIHTKTSLNDNSLCTAHVK